MRGDRLYNGEFVTMRDELENYPVNTQFVSGGFSAPPSSFTGPAGFAWGLNRLTAQTAAGEWARVVDLSADPVGGANGVINASHALRIRTITAQQPGNLGIYQGAALYWDTPLHPVAGINARVSAEMFIPNASGLFSFEPFSWSALSGLARVIWGGTCVDFFECNDLRLPAGPIDGIRMLIPNLDFAWGPYIYVHTRYCMDARGNVFPGCTPPPGRAVGDIVPVPLGQWARMAYETTLDARRIVLLDAFDGAGEIEISGDSLLIGATAGYIDGVRWAASYESVNAELLIDNIEASGPLYIAPEPPPLDCPYLDDLDWMDLGIAQVQAGQWTFSLSLNQPQQRRVQVVEEPGRGRVLANAVSYFDDRYRRDFARELPPTNLSTDADFVVSVDVRTDRLGVGWPAANWVRGFALYNGPALAARVIFGNWTDPNDASSFDPGVFVQINPAYDPIDPFNSHPFDNAPVIGVDLVDTGYDWSNGEYRRLTLRASANGALRVLIDDTLIYAGEGVFSGAIDRIAFESEHNPESFGANFASTRCVSRAMRRPAHTDFTFDDLTNFADLNIVLANFGASNGPGFTPGDANADGVVNFADLNATLAAFGTGCR